MCLSPFGVSDFVGGDLNVLAIDSVAAALFARYVASSRLVVPLGDSTVWQDTVILAACRQMLLNHGNF
jgi:hypothetical protein